MKCVSLFAGIGGFDLALTRQGHEIVYANEWDKYAAQTYEKNFKHRPDTRSITDVPTSDIPDHDLLVGGFPCQGFSIAGKRLGFADTRGTLFFEIARIARVKKPTFLLLENVKGLLSHDNGRTFKTIISTLDELGYDLQWQVINSEYYTQQNRQRIYIFGVFRARNGSTKFKKMESLWDLDKRATKTLPTISTKPIGRGECVIIEAKGQRRWLTERECERLQGFPDDWTKGVSMTQRYKQLGNAVTVNVVEEIIKRLSFN